MTAIASMSFATIAVAGLSITNGVPEQNGGAAVAINDVREVRAAYEPCLLPAPRRSAMGSIARHPRSPPTGG
jgi:hypothetical protein